MTPRFPLLAVPLLVSLSSAHAAVTVLYSEDFSQGNGLYIANPEVRAIGVSKFEAWGNVQNVADNQLSTLVPTAGSFNGSGGLRFGAVSSRTNWAGGTIGSTITAAGGFTVAFDWTESGSAGSPWIGYKVGTLNSDQKDITIASIDHAILFYDDGAVQSYDTGVKTNDLVVGTTTGTTHTVLLTYLFSSFTAGSTVNFTANVDGSNVVASSFTWDATNDMRMEFQTNNDGELIDNFVVATVPEPSSVGLLLGGLSLLALRRRR